MEKILGRSQGHFRLNRRDYRCLGMISTAGRTERIPGIDVLLGVCRALAVTPDQLFRRVGLLPAEGRGEVVRFARFREEERG